MAICRYFEEIQPDPPLMGRDARDMALVEFAAVVDRGNNFRGAVDYAEVYLGEPFTR